MRAIRRILVLLSFLLVLPAFTQDDRQDPGDPESPPSEEQPEGQPSQGGLLGLFRAPQVTVGSTALQLRGDIDPRDGLDPELRLKYEDFRILVEAGRRLRISAISQLMDPHLRILSADRSRVLAEDADSGLGQNARLIFTTPERGEYVVRVLAAYRGFNGPYDLVIEPAPVLRDPSPLEGNVVESTRWSGTSGTLTPDDLSLDGLFFDDYRIRLNASEEVFVRLDSTEFDPVVQIYPAAAREGDFLAMDDDSGPGRNSLLIFRATEQGEYVVRVTTFSSRRPTGSYILRIGRSVAP